MQAISKCSDMQYVLDVKCLWAHFLNAGYTLTDKFRGREPESTKSYLYCLLNREFFCMVDVMKLLQ